MNGKVHQRNMSKQRLSEASAKMNEAWSLINDAKFHAMAADWDEMVVNCEGLELAAGQLASKVSDLKESK